MHQRQRFFVTSSLTTVTLNEGLYKITGSPFTNSPVTSITSYSERSKVYNSVELVDTGTETLVGFMCNNLKGGRHEVSDSVKVIGESSFQGCSGLKYVVLNEGLNTIDSHAFMSTGLE